jgi:sortase A
MTTTLVVHNVEVSDADDRDDPAPDVVGGGVDNRDPDLAETGGATREPAPSGIRRRITFWVGVGLILAGLGLLGYVAWQFWGTNWVSKRHQREITNALQEDWQSGHAKKPKFVPTGQASALIRIPRLGKKYVVPVLEGVTPDVLARGYGHFEDTADPGEIGNYALAAHRVTHGEPLRHMPDLRPGDKVLVETVSATYTYVLDTNPNDLVIPFTGVWVLHPLPHNPKPGGPEPAQAQGQRLITLTTCSEIFHTDDRMIAFGHLASVTTKPPAKADRARPAPGAGTRSD